MLFKTVFSTRAPFYLRQETLSLHLRQREPAPLLHLRLYDSGHVTYKASLSLSLSLSLRRKEGYSFTADVQLQSHIYRRETTSLFSVQFKSTHTHTIHTLTHTQRQQFQTNIGGLSGACLRVKGEDGEGEGREEGEEGQAGREKGGKGRLLHDTINNHSRVVMQDMEHYSLRYVQYLYNLIDCSLCEYNLW